MATHITYDIYFFPEYRLNKLNIYVGNEQDIDANANCISFNGVFGASETKQFACSTPGLCGQYVFIRRIDPLPEELNAPLGFCEVEVYGICY